MEYLSYYGLEDNLFNKAVSSEDAYESKDYNNVISRLNYLKEIKGIGVFTGSPGLGKSYTLKCFIESLNPDLYKVIYISPTDLGKFEFFSRIAKQLNIDIGACYKDELYDNIQKEIKRLIKEQMIEVIIVVDDAQYIDERILKDLKILFDFGLDSKDYTTIILCGYDEIRLELSKLKYETIRQRVVVNYKFEGLSREEVKEYIESRLEKVKQTNKIFNEEALNALYNTSRGNPRRLNSLIINSFIIGSQKEKEIIDGEVIMMAKNEIVEMIKDNLILLYNFDDNALINIRKYCYERAHKRYKKINNSNLIYFTEEALAELINCDFLYDFREIE